MIYRIDYLANHQDKINDISDVLYKEWSHLIPGKTQEDVTESIKERINTNMIPLAIIAIDSNQNWIGTVAVKQYDLDSRKEYSPWFSAFYVKELYRNQGIGLSLMNNRLQITKEMGLDYLYLYTEKAEDYYLKHGWELLNRQIESGTQISIMKYNLKVKI